jgi:hypothetical protein
MNSGLVSSLLSLTLFANSAYAADKDFCFGNNVLNGKNVSYVIGYDLDMQTRTSFIGQFLYLDINYDGVWQPRIMLNNGNGATSTGSAVSFSLNVPFNATGQIIHGGKSSFMDCPGLR